MGEVVSIAKAKQTDIFSMFDSGCPALPEITDEAVIHSASRSVARVEVKKPGASRVACLVIGGVSLIGIALSYLTAETSTNRDLTSSVAGHSLLTADSALIGSFSSDLIVTEEFTLNTQVLDERAWRLSREAWLAHIAALERDPAYQQILREKRLFAMTYPDQPK